MSARQLASPLQQFVDNELLHAPLLFDQLIDGTIDHGRKALPEMSPLQRSNFGDLMQALLAQRGRLSDYFMRSLRDQVHAELDRHRPRAAASGVKPSKLALVDEDSVALDVELAHTIEAVKSVAEYELRELQTFVSALVGDMDVAADHNPFRGETYARAMWAAAQALPLSRGHQVTFMRHASTPLAQILRKSYAAATSRLEAMGVEPAAYRTMILPPGSRRGARSAESTFSPDLHHIRDTMPAPLDEPLRLQGQPVAQVTAPGPAKREHWSEVARAATAHADRQSIELVSRLFEAMLSDERVPDDVGVVIARLQGPAMRLTLRDPNMLDQVKHPLWRFVNRLVFEAEMAPDKGDPERRQLLKQALATAEQLASEPDQNTAVYRWALERLEGFLETRLARRLSASASQIGALQKLEDKLLAGQAEFTSFHGMLDVPQLDTVPAELMTTAQASASAPAGRFDDWIDNLSPGDWVRMFLQGRWVQARLLWPGDRREVWLFGDGASDATWAIRRGALLAMQRERLVKPLKQRSIVGAAALHVQEQVAGTPV